MMGQKPYYRDVWVLPNSHSKYPGAFPGGLLTAMKKQGWWGDNRLWMFSGSHKDITGTTVDIKPEVQPDIVADCSELPMTGNKYDFVMADPPYSEKEARELYHTDYPKMAHVVNEMFRVAKNGGYVVLLHRLVPFTHPIFTQDVKRAQQIALVGVVTMAGFSNMRALSVWRKQPGLDFKKPSNGGKADG